MMKPNHKMKMGGGGRPSPYSRGGDSGRFGGMNRRGMRCKFLSRSCFTASV